MARPRVQLAGEDYGFAAFHESVDALVMGRSTYDVARSLPDGPYAAGAGEHALEFEHSQSWAQSGLVQLVYRAH